ncbi:hypothetical protein AQUCO_01100144v1 [Aquilegia coerulea]|uniref:F-box associated beta-propeller type 3 domain-containing protein n=1 Tax=Aquilegia coerulea TaxID=218851 RepID=A0A2G5E5Q8_AQUCA|nr:hypothetical protein AQUCO_01100144v1 [Aquilegia coerulea]
MVVPHSYYICNTITQEHVILPTLPPQLITDHVGLHGFGYDSDTDTYKVIRIYPTSSISSAEVCTLGLGKWRRIEDVPSFRNYSPVCEFVNGSLHWLTFDKNHNMVIVSFNLSTEKFGIIPSPHVANTNIRSIGVLEDCPRIVSLTYNRDLINDGIISDHDFIMELWVMKNYGVQESWTKEYVFANAIPTLFFLL